MCQAFPALSDSKSIFVSGCDNFQLKPIEKHNTSKCHQACMRAEEGRKKKEQQCVTEAGTAVRMIDKATIDGVRPIFRNCHALAMNARPFTDITWMCELDSIKGILSY